METVVITDHFSSFVTSLDEDRNFSFTVTDAQFVDLTLILMISIRGSRNGDQFDFLDMQEITRLNMVANQCDTSTISFDEITDFAFTNFILSKNTG